MNEGSSFHEELFHEGLPSLHVVVLPVLLRCHVEPSYLIGKVQQLQRTLAMLVLLHQCHVTGVILLCVYLSLSLSLLH